MNCRGHKKRLQIAENYDIKPVAHIKLLKGQTKHSDAEAVIKNEYYIFTAKSKVDEINKTITCGMGAARDFLNILNIPGLPLFNPLYEEDDKKAAAKSESTTNEDINKDIDNWNDTAKQLYNAIMWLIIAWDAKPDTPLYKFKDEIIEHKSSTPSNLEIKRVNTVITNGGNGQTMTEIVNKFRTNNKLNDNLCNFSLLSKRMAKITDKNGNEIKSFF